MRQYEALKAAKEKKFEIAIGAGGSTGTSRKSDTRIWANLYGTKMMLSITMEVEPDGTETYKITKLPRFASGLNTSFKVLAEGKLDDLLGS